MGNSKSSKSEHEPVDGSKIPPKTEIKPNPWRDMGRNFNWDQETEEKLKRDLKEIKAIQEVTDFRVLLLGPVGAGKSSFINSIASIDKERIAHAVMVGAAKKSKTTKLKEFRPTNLIEHVILSDTMGIEAIDQEGFNVQDVVYLINGNVPLDYQFNSRWPIDPSKCALFKENPDESDKSHCVAFAIDVQLIVEENIPSQTKAKLAELQDKIDKLDVPTVILLTHIDSQCENLQKTFYSVKVEKAVKTASEMFGIPELHIFPVKNYSSEGSLDTMKNILHLTALKQMIHFAADFLEMRRHHFARSKLEAKQKPHESRTMKPKAESTGKTEAFKMISYKSERGENAIHDLLKLGQNVSARFKEGPKGMSETWQDGHVAAILMEGQLYNIDFGDGKTRFLKITDIKPK